MIEKLDALVSRGVFASRSAGLATLVENYGNEKVGESALSRLQKVLAGEDGRQRNGIEMDKEAFIEVMDGDDHYFDDVEAERITLACVDGQFGWLDSGKPYTSTLLEQVSEADAAWILQHGIVRKDAGAV
jgi:Arc/MetJ-type ribon-helix-helix transcriptional regulator